jgi:hypothetical protein
MASICPRNRLTRFSSLTFSFATWLMFRSTHCSNIGGYGIIYQILERCERLVRGALSYGALVAVVPSIAAAQAHLAVAAWGCWIKP